MSHEIINSYNEMMRQVAMGRAVAMIPATDEDGEGMLWMTAVECDEVDLRAPAMGLLLAAATCRRAYREARKNGVDTVI